MFVRQKRNRSGSVSVQVVEKSHGYRVVKTIGSARDPEELNRLAQLPEFPDSLECLYGSRLAGV